MILVAILTVRRAELASFRAFEHAAAAVMERHGGAIERTVVVDAGEPDTLREVHLVRFTSPAAFAAYGADPGLAAIRALRDRSVLATELLVGTDGPVYAPGGRS